MTPGVIKAFLYYAEFKKSNQIGLLHKQMDTLSSENDNLSFLLL